MTPPDSIPPFDYRRILVVKSFEELVSTPMENGVNAICWPRHLEGNFEEIVAGLGFSEGINPVEDEQLLALSLSAGGDAARKILLQDLELLRSHDLLPSLDCIHRTARDTRPVPTDVYSWHADSATAQADTYLCTYAGACSEGLRNEDAIRRVDIPETRALLLSIYGGKDDEGFLEFLNENYYDLHYVPKPGAQPYAFGFANLWRVATEYPDNPVPPCIHRAPETLPGDPPRLLLIS